MKPAPPPPNWKYCLAKALDPSYTGAPPEIALACTEAGRWDGTWPVIGLRRVALYAGYPPGTEKKTTGNSMFLRTTPFAEGVYTFPKIAYEPGKKKSANHKKTGEYVHYRKAKESDVPAIKEKLGLDY